MKALAFLVLSMVIMATSARAQEVVLNPTSAAAAIQATKNEAKKKPVSTLKKDGGDYYTPVTLQNLVNLYWRTGMFDTNDVDAVKEYLALTSCELYKANSNDDFNWPKVIDATQKYLREYSGTFPTQFQYVQPIGIDRYDIKTEQFNLIPGMGYKNKQSLIFADFTGYSICDNKQSNLMPMIAEIRLPAPFNLNTLSIKTDFAKTLVDYMDNVAEPINIDNRPIKRYAYVTFYITILGMNEGQDNKRVAHFTGQLDGYEVFMDLDKTLPVTKWVNE